MTSAPPDRAGVVLHWLPLGGGGRFVRRNGRVFEALAARRDHRSVCDLYHSALEVTVGAERFVIEMTPAWSGGTTDRGVVREGPVGSRGLGRLRLFRYEVRRWRDGVLADPATDGTSRQVRTDPVRARRLLELVPTVPVLTWGRDERHTGDMWNSNSLTAWLLARSGHRMDRIDLPPHGRAPGWSAGLVVAAREQGDYRPVSGALSTSNATATAPGSRTPRATSPT
jgi:hypothetical protein